MYTHPFTGTEDWAGWARVDYSYHGRSATDFRPTSVTTYRIQHAYDLTTLRLGTSNERAGLDMDLYVDNVFDVAGEVFVVAATATPTAKYTTQPRTIGFEVTKKF